MTSTTPTTSGTRAVRHHLPAGTASSRGCSVLVSPSSAGWDFSGLAVLELAPGEARSWSTGSSETLVLPLSGGCRVRCEGTTYDVHGRADVFGGPSDFVYLPRDTELTVTSDGGGRFALPS